MFLPIFIDVNGVQQQIIWNGNCTLLLQSFNILASDHEIGRNCNGTIVDDLGIFISLLDSLNQETMFRLYDSNCALWKLRDSVPVPFFYGWYQNAAIMTSFSFVKRYKKLYFMD